MSNDYIYVGQKAARLNTSDPFPAYTGVLLKYDDENAFMAGDDSGRVLEAACPWATQAMAEDMLASIKGCVYRPYEAANAILDPAAELGDVVNVGGVLGLLASIDTYFDAMCAADISAPAEQEVDHEYPYLSPMERELGRRVKLGMSYYGTTITRSKGIEISAVAADGTKLRRALLNSDVLAFYSDDGAEALYFDPVAGRYKFSGDVNIVGGSININDKFVVDAEGNVAMSGDISWGRNSPYKSQFSETGEDDDWHDKMTADDLYRRDTYDGGETWCDAYQFRGVDGEDGSDAKVPNYIKSTYIDFDSVESPMIIGNIIRTLGTFEVGFCETDDFEDDFVGTGFMGYAQGLDAAGETTEGVAMSNANTLEEGDYYVIVTNAGVRLQAGSTKIYAVDDAAHIVVGGTDLKVDGSGVYVNNVPIA